MNVETLQELERIAASQNFIQVVVLIVVFAVSGALFMLVWNLRGNGNIMHRLITVLGSTTSGFADVEASMKDTANSIRLLAEQIKANSQSIQQHSEALEVHNNAVRALTDNQTAMHKAASLRDARLDRLSSNLDALTVNVELVAENWAKASSALERVLDLLHQQNLATAEVTDRLNGIDDTQVKQAAIISSQIQELRKTVLDYITQQIEKQIEEVQNDRDSIDTGGAGESVGGTD